MRYSYYKRRPKPTVVPDRLTFRSNNGDALQQLNDSKSEVEQRLKSATEELRNKNEELKPYREAVERLAGEHMNLGARLNIWWGEFKEAGGEG